MGTVQYINQNKAVVYACSCVCALVLIASNGFASERLVSDPSQDQFSYNAPIISKLKPEQAHGRGFKLEYVVDAPLDVFWKYKTNFDILF